MLLESINSSQDLKKFSIDQLPQIASEIRQVMVETISLNGGHLASSLGAVEIITALHYCLNTPQDKIIFDVGHQSYAHKILTGRNKNFHTLRQYKGISGFPAANESAYDTFTTGHSSTAVSLALGLACARDSLSAQEYFKVVAVIGDGSLSGGLCFEGINNAGHLKKDILVILNTNELSIAPNVGALSTYLNKLMSLPLYNRFKSSLENFVKSRISKGRRLLEIANKFEEGLKGLFIPGLLFEELGFRYFGPLDGHNFNILVPTLKNILNIKGPILLHIVTKKGKGYPPAQDNPVKFHSASSFDIPTGKPLKEPIPGVKSYTEIFSEKLAQLARDNKKIIAVTAAMPEGTGVDRFRDLYPERFFDVGIAEGHAVCFAAGLAKEGAIPVVAVYSTFLQRAYDQIIEEVALQNLPVIFAIDRAGIVGEDGVTHQGIFDIAFLRHIPNLVIMAPKDGRELEGMLEFAVNLKKPVAIRYPKAVSSDVSVSSLPIEIGKMEVLKKGLDFSIIALGSALKPSLEAVELLEKEGLAGTLINARFVKPIDIHFLKNIITTTKIIFTVEEGVLDGGFGSLISEIVDRKVIRIGLPCEFITHGKREILLDKYNLTAEAIAKKIKSVVSQE